ncbi:rhsC domain protein, partial [Escherichia coli 3-475-03_S4_C2]
AAAFLTHPVSQDFTFQPVEHLHQHRREHHTATVFAAGLLKGIRQAAALRFRQLTGGGFNSDEWREAPISANLRVEPSEECDASVPR